MTKFITLFSGCGGFEEGAIAAGWTHAGGIDSWIYAVEAQALRSREIEYGDILKYDFSHSPWGEVDHIHASPPCVNASIAKGFSKETALDIAYIDSTIDALTHVKPDTFSLENVPNYKNFSCFNKLCDWLSKENYYLKYSVFNAASFGVPQNRLRLILTASSLAQPGNLLDYYIQAPFRSWYSAIEDLIWELPDSKLTNWQIKALDGMLPDTPALIPKAGARLRNGRLNWIAKDSPSRTIRALGGDRHWQQFSLYLPANLTSSPAKVKQVSIQCYGRLQGFDDSFVFPYPNHIAMKLIGNAVPPPMAKAIAQSLID